MKLAKGIWLMLVLFLLSCVLAVIWFMTMSYNELIDFAINQLHRPDLRSVLENRFFTNEKFIGLQRMGYSIIPAGLAVLGFFIVKRKMITRGMQALVRTIKRYVKGLIQCITQSDAKIQAIFGIILLLVCVRSIYNALHFYPQYDECWNYNYFLSNNIFTSVFAYNNYPLHNLLTYLTLSVLPDSTFAMRLPNIILGLLNIILVFYLLKRVFKNEKIALAGIAIFSVLPTVVFYFLFARGIMLALTFALLLLFFFLTKKINTWKKVDVLIVALLGALGCYSMISFPIYLALLFTIAGIQSLYNKDKQSFRKIGYTSLWLSLFTGILYLPMFLGSGFELGLTSNYTSHSANWLLGGSEDLKISKDQIGFNFGAYLFIAINILLLFFKRRKTIIWLSLLLLLTPYLLAPVGVHLPARAIGFQILAYLLTVVLCLELLLKFSNTLVLSIVTLLLALVWNYKSTHHTFFDWSGRPDKGAYEMAQVLQENKINSYYDLEGNYSYYAPSILYHHKLNGKDIKYYTSNTKSARYKSIDQYKGKVYITVGPVITSDTLENKVLYQYKDESNEFKLIQAPQDLLHEAP